MFQALPSTLVSAFCWTNFSSNKLPNKSITMRRFLLISFLLLGSRVFSQDVEDLAFKTDTLNVNQKGLNVIGLPIVFVTPETGFGFGGGAQFFLLRKSNVYNSRLSNILVSGIYTLNQQLLIDIRPQLYIQRGNYLLDASYKFQIFPNRFWGVGPNTPDSNEESYNMTSSELRIAFLKRLPPKLNFGFEYISNFHDVTEVEEGGLLASETIEGNKRATISGLGVIFNLDSRDNIASPFSGNFFQINARFSSKNLGATHGFNTFILNLRSYLPLGKKSIIALQLYTQNNYGDVPFQSKVWYGGGEMARGYFRGRFIDNHAYVLQAEYRLRFASRWTMAGFALVGEVADLPENFFNYLKPSAGGGVRFKLVKTKDTLLRLDFGFGIDGNNGIYFGVNEAF